MWQPTVRNTLDHTLFPPGFEVFGLCYRPRVLDPLDDLGHGYEVDVVVVGEDLVHPEEEGVQELGVVFQPSGVEVQAEGRAVLLVMAVKIVVQEVVELIAGEDVRAGVDHSATGEVFVVAGVFPPVEFV